MIRTFIDTDLTSIAAIEQQSDPSPWKFNTLCDSIQHQNYRCWIIIEENTVIGYSLLRNNPDCMELLKLAIAPNYRRKGYAYQLLQHILTINQQHNKLKVMLEVRASNKAAIALYKKVGFKQINNRKNYYISKNGKKEDALIMAFIDNKQNISI